MSNTFSNNKKVKLIATVVAEEAPYIKTAKSYMSQGELDGKKYGKSYKIYIPDTGSVKDGLVASPEDIIEREVEVTLDNINTSVELDAWEKLTDIEDFKKEVAIPRGRKLARSLEKKAIDASVFKAAQAVVVNAASFAGLSQGAALLQEVAVADKLVTFIKPTDAAKIAATGLANFIPAEIQKDIYSKHYLGEYAGASVVEESLMPVVSVPASPSTPTVTVTADGVKGFKPVSTLDASSFDAVDGLAFKIVDDNGNYVKVVGVDGMETDQDYVLIQDKAGKFAEIRITAEGKNYNNPNAWCATGAASFTLVPMLTASTKYNVAVVRGEKSLGYDNYKFSDLPGSENATESSCGISIKMSSYGDGTNMKTMTRLDAPHAISVPDNREFAVIFMAN